MATVTKETRRTLSGISSGELDMLESAVGLPEIMLALGLALPQASP